MDNKKELSKEERIKKEERRLKRIYKDLPKDKLAIADGLIYRAAFMRVTLEDMEKDLNDNGFVEMFTQSEKTPPYEKDRPTARQYQQMNKNYQTIIKQLSDLLPKDNGNTTNTNTDDGFDSFVMRRD